MTSLSPATTHKVELLASPHKYNIDSVVRKIRLYGQMTNNEVNSLASYVSGTRHFTASKNIASPGEKLAYSIFLLEGWAGRYKVLRNGARQITALYLPGDFINLQSFLPMRTNNGVIALSQCATAQVSHENLQRITETEPRLTRLLWTGTLADAATHREWLAIMGQLSAAAGTAHLICELYTRLKAVGLADSHRFRCPITQPTLADTLGLSAVHLNRSVQALRAKNLIRWHRDEVIITDWDQLVDWGEFDPTYLQMSEGFE